MQLDDTVADRREGLRGRLRVLVMLSADAIVGMIGDTYDDRGHVTVEMTLFGRVRHQNVSKFILEVYGSGQDRADGRTRRYAQLEKVPKSFARLP